MVPVVELGIGGHPVEEPPPDANVGVEEEAQDDLEHGEDPGELGAESRAQQEEECRSDHDTVEGVDDEATHPVHVLG